MNNKMINLEEAKKLMRQMRLRSEPARQILEMIRQHGRLPIWKEHVIKIPDCGRSSTEKLIQAGLVKDGKWPGEDYNLFLWCKLKQIELQNPGQVIFHCEELGLRFAGAVELALLLKPNADKVRIEVRGIATVIMKRGQHGYWGERTFWHNVEPEKAKPKPQPILKKPGRDCWKLPDRLPEGEGDGECEKTMNHLAAVISKLDSSKRQSCYNRELLDLERKIDHARKEFNQRQPSAWSRQ
jgi:hypothetical protein